MTTRTNIQIKVWTDVGKNIFDMHFDMQKFIPHFCDIRREISIHISNVVRNNITYNIWNTILEEIKK